MYKVFLWMSKWDYLFTYFWYLAYTKWHEMPLLSIPYEEYEIPKDEYQQLSVMSTDLWSTTSICVNEKGIRVLVTRRRTNVTRRAQRRLAILKPMVDAITCVACRSWLPQVYHDYETMFTVVYDVPKLHNCVHIYDMTDSRIVMEYKEPDDNKCMLNIASQLYHEIETGVFHAKITNHTYVQSGNEVWSQECTDVYELKGDEREQAIQFILGWSSKEWYLPLHTTHGREYLVHILNRWAYVDGRIRMGDMYILNSIECVPRWMWQIVNALCTSQQQYQLK
jgi:hypothetical protein